MEATSLSILNFTFWKFPKLCSNICSRNNCR